MKREEILERNKKSLSVNGDEREILISGRANIIAKGVFSVTIALLILFKQWKGLDTYDLWGVFFIYCASESLYKYYCLKEKKILFTGIGFTIAAICYLAVFFLKMLGA